MGWREYKKHSLSILLNVSKIVTFYSYVFEKNYVSISESHDFWELIYVTEGKVVLKVDDETLELQENEMYFYKPCEEHAVHGDGESRAKVTIISFECMSEVMRFFEKLKVTVGKSEYEIVQRIKAEFRRSFYMPVFDIPSAAIVRRENGTIGADQLIRNHVEELLISIIRKNAVDDAADGTNASEEEENKNITDAVCNYLSQNLNRKVTIEELCQVFNFGKTYISTAFKMDTGFTIIDYFNHMKCEYAKGLIAENQLTLTQISETLGFSSLYYFSRIFKQMTGMSPAQYKSLVPLEAGRAYDKT